MSIKKISALSISSFLLITLTSQGEEVISSQILKPSTTRTYKPVYQPQTDNSYMGTKRRSLYFSIYYGREFGYLKEIRGNSEKGDTFTGNRFALEFGAFTQQTSFYSVGLSYTYTANTPELVSNTDEKGNYKPLELISVDIGYGNLYKNFLFEFKVSYIGIYMRDTNGQSMNFNNGGEAFEGYGLEINLGTVVRRHILFGVNARFLDSNIDLNLDDKIRGASITAYVGLVFF